MLFKDICGPFGLLAADVVTRLRVRDDMPLPGIIPSPAQIQDVVHPTMGNWSVTLARTPNQVIFSLNLSAQLETCPLAFQLSSDFSIATHDVIIVPRKITLCEIISQSALLEHSANQSEQISLGISLLEFLGVRQVLEDSRPGEPQLSRLLI